MESNWGQFIDTEKETEFYKKNDKIINIRKKYYYDDGDDDDDDDDNNNNKDSFVYALIINFTIIVIAIRF